MNEEVLKEARNKLAVGRILARNKFPFYARGLDAIEVIEKHNFGKITIDKFWRLYYDPEICLKWSVEEISAVWIHNLEHLFRNHPRRFDNLKNENSGEMKNELEFNRACDALINQDLLKQGMVMPDPESQIYVSDGKDFGWNPKMTAEQMYHLRMEALRRSVSDENLSTDNLEPPEHSNPSDSHTELSKGDSTEQIQSTDRNNSDPSDSNDLSDTSIQNESEGTLDTTAEINDENNNIDSEYDSLESNSSEDGSANSDNSCDNESSDKQNSSQDLNQIPKRNQEDSSNTNKTENPSQNQDASHSTSSDAKTQNSNSGNSDSSILENFDEFDDFKTNSQNASQQETDKESHFEEKEENSSKFDTEHDCGSGAGGEIRDFESSTDEKAIDESTGESLKMIMAEEIIEYDMSNPGTVSAGLVRDAKKILEPEVDWHREFMNYVNNTIGRKKGVRFQNRRRLAKKHSSANPIIRPGKEAPKPPEFAVILDTSASMEEKRELALALGSIKELIKKFGRNSAKGGLHVISCDVEGSIDFAKSLDEINILGGGGTDMRKGIDIASRLRPKVDIIIVATDGGTPWPKEKPRENITAEYIVVLVSNINIKTIPSWMKVIKLSIPESRSNFVPYK